MRGEDRLQSAVELPWPPKQLTPNAKRRTHWRVYQPIAKRYRTDCAILTKAARIGIAAGDVPVLMSITFYPPDRRQRDDDGMIGAFKAGRDGIADALGIDDRHFRPSYHIAESVKGGKVIITIGKTDSRDIDDTRQKAVANREGFPRLSRQSERPPSLDRIDRLTSEGA